MPGIPVLEILQHIPLSDVPTLDGVGGRLHRYPTKQVAVTSEEGTCPYRIKDLVVFNQ